MIFKSLSLERGDRIKPTDRKKIPIFKHFIIYSLKNKNKNKQKNKQGKLKIKTKKQINKTNKEK